MSKCVFNKSDLNLDLQDRLQDALEEIWGEQDEMSRKTMFINNLNFIREAMVGENSLKYFVNLLLELLAKANRLMLGYKHLRD